MAPNEKDNAKARRAAKRAGKQAEHSAAAADVGKVQPKEAVEEAAAAAAKAAQAAAKRAAAEAREGANAAAGDDDAALSRRAAKQAAKEAAEKADGADDLAKARKKASTTFAAFKATRMPAKDPTKAAIAQAGLKKRKRDDSDKKSAPPAKAVTADSAEGENKKKKGKRGKKKKPEEVEAEPLSATATEEERRRFAQKQMQQLVIRLQKEGKSKHEIADAKQELARTQGSFRQEDSLKVKKSKIWHEWVQTDDYKQEEEKKVKEHKEKVHDLAIIPVIWRGRHDAQDVEGAAEDIKACVAQQGVDAWIDSRRHYTPGQKFAHWEHRGVMLRVEIGPDDFKAGVCQVCKAEEPGKYLSVQKKKVRLPPRGARQLLLQLKEFGLSKIDIERRKGDSDSEGEDPAAATAAKKPKTPAEMADDELIGNYAPRAAPAKDKNKFKKK